MLQVVQCRDLRFHLVTREDVAKEPGEARRQGVLSLPDLAPTLNRSQELQKLQEGKAKYVSASPHEDDLRLWDATITGPVRLAPHWRGE